VRKTKLNRIAACAWRRHAVDLESRPRQAFAAAAELRARRLVTLPECYKPDPVAMCAVYPHARHLASNRHLASKVRTFLYFLAQRFAGEAEWHQGRS
jgi:DNA-binding transcriptional LysR family regulator